MTTEKKYWPRRLHQLMADAAHKIKLRARRPPDPVKWPASGVDEEGNRDWLRCSVGFLIKKLTEEFDELLAEAVEYDQSIATMFGDLNEVRSRVRFEVADVAAVAMMLAERCGVYDDLPSMPRIVCLCGSTRFRDAFTEMNERETLAGRVVLSVGSFRRAAMDTGGWLEFEEEVKENLDALHRQKIDLADEILVLNVGGYVGESTRSEIEHAYRTGKAVRYLELPLAVCDGQHAEAALCIDMGCWQLSNPIDPTDEEETTA